MDNASLVEKDLGVFISLHGGKCCMSVSRGTIKSLGFPTHITFTISDSNDSISVFPCDEKNIMSFKVPTKLFVDHHCVMRIHSKRFVHGLMGLNGMDIDRTYTLSGEYFEDKNAAVFSLVDGVTMRPLPAKKGVETDLEDEPKGEPADV